MQYLEIATLYREPSNRTILMSLPNHYPMNFPYDDTNYLEALVKDYRELMGEIADDATENPSHTLLIEYKNSHPVSIPQSNE